MNNNILNLIVKAQYQVLTAEEAETLQKALRVNMTPEELFEALMLKEDLVNRGKALDEKEKAMLKELKGRIKADDVKKLSNGKNKELSYLSWAQICHILNDVLGKENWAKSPLVPLAVQELVDNTGYNVYVGISLFKGKLTLLQELCVMDSGNNPIKRTAYSFKRKDYTVNVEGIDSFNLNKNHQRCFVKGIAVLTDLGIELYTGEDLPNPDDEKAPADEKKTTPKTDKKSTNGDTKKTPKETPKKDETPEDDDEPF